MITAAVGTAMSQAGEHRATVPGGSLGKDEFLELLVAQLRNQDPLNPMQPQDMAVQLAQFTSVEQLIQLNEQLSAQAVVDEALVRGFAGNSALGLIGKSVIATTDQVVVPADGTGVVSVEVGAGGGTAKLTLLDAEGNAVGTRELGHLPAGRHSIELGEAAADLPPGTYAIRIDVVDAEGEPVPAVALTRATIDGVRYTDDGLVLVGGPLEFRIQDVVEVFSNP